MRQIRNINLSYFFIEKTNENKFNKNKNVCNFISKNDLVRLKCFKTNEYIAIKQIKTNLFEFSLEKTSTGISMFNLRYVSDDDKMWVSIFDQLNASFDYFLEFYLNQIKNPFPDDMASENSEEKREEALQIINTKKFLSNILDIFIKYKNSKNNNADIKNKLDISKDIQQFKIVDKILKLGVSLWKIVDFDSKNDGINEIEDKENDKEIKIEFESIISGKISEALQDKIDCTKILFNVLNIIFCLDPNINKSTYDFLYRLFFFIGKINAVTKFLIELLRDNKILLLKLISNV